MSVEQPWHPVPLHGTPLYPGCPELFAQTGGTIDAVRDTAVLTRTEGMGAVFTMTTGHHLERLEVLVREHHRLAGPPDHVLFDANRYSGKNRRTGQATLDPRWIVAQRRAGTRMALTDSPYLPAQDYLALTSTWSRPAASART